MTMTPATQKEKEKALKAGGFPDYPDFPIYDPNFPVYDSGAGVVQEVEGVLIAGIVIGCLIYVTLFIVGLYYAIQNSKLYGQNKISGSEIAGSWTGFGIGVFFPLINITPPICFGLWHKRPKIHAKTGDMI